MYQIRWPALLIQGVLLVIFPRQPANIPWRWWMIGILSTICKQEKWDPCEPKADWGLGLGGVRDRLPFRCAALAHGVWALLGRAPITFFLSNRRLCSWQAFPRWSDSPGEQWACRRPLLWTSSWYSEVLDCLPSDRVTWIIIEQR